MLHISEVVIMEGKKLNSHIAWKPFGIYSKQCPSCILHEHTIHYNTVASPILHTSVLAPVLQGYTTDFMLCVL